MHFVEGKVALITGGASGIGLSIAQKLLENGIKGVGLVDISEEDGRKVVKDFQKSFNDKVIFIKADVCVEKEFEDAFEKIIDKFKHLDIVVNNAGIADEVHWEKCVAVNLVGVIRGTFLSMEKYLPRFKSSKEGVIINTASILGINEWDDLPIYCTTKHGVIGLGKSLGSENIWRKHNVRIMTICPGAISTPLLMKATADKDINELLSALTTKMAPPEYIGTSVVKIINEGKHGSVWILENEDSPYEVTFPCRTELRKVQS